MNVRSALGGLVTVMIAAAYLYFGPEIITASAALQWVQATLVAGVMGVAAWGLGQRMLGLLAPALCGKPGEWLYALGLGIGAYGLLFSGLAGAGYFGLATVAIAIGCGLPVRLGRWIPPRPGLPGWALALLAVLLFPALTLAFSPPVDTDEIYQHLALARRIAESGSLVGGFDLPEGSRPQWVQATFAAAYLFGGAAAAKVWHLALSLALLLGVAELANARFGEGRATAPVLVAAGSYTFLHEAGLAYNDLPAALFVVLAAEFVLREQHKASATADRVVDAPIDAKANFPLIFGLLLGFATTAKLTAAPACFALGVCFAIIGLRRAGMASSAPTALAAVVALGLFAPWALRNVAAGLHPGFPYAGWPEVEGFRFLYPEKYGVGHTWLDAARLPFDLLFRARIDSFAFLGQISLGWAALLAGALLAARRRIDVRILLGVLLISFVAWANTGQILRYLLPLVGVAMLAGAASSLRWPALFLALVSLPANVFPVFGEAVRTAPVIAGRESEEKHLQRELLGWRAVAYLREHVPKDQPVALLYAWQTYWINQPTRLGSVEDHTPTRHWISAHGDDSLAELHRRGVRWLLVGDSGFLRKTYAFLPDAAYLSQFVRPREQLERLLLRDAVREFDDGHWAVWRLDAPQAGD
jgi:hypothetical protein